MSEGQNEEVLVRLYRLLELLGQMRLFAHGIDSGSVDPDDSRVKAWLSACNAELRKNRDGRYELARREAASLLLDIETRCGEGPELELARKLASLEWLGEWGPTMRNTSVLIHGFRARSRGRDRELKQLMEKLTELYCGEAEGIRLCSRPAGSGF